MGACTCVLALVVLMTGVAGQADDYQAYDLSTVLPRFTEVYDISDTGEIVGGMPVGAYHHAFRWSLTEGLVDLGTLGGYNSGAKAINGLGFVAGYAYAKVMIDGQEHQVGHAALWSPSGVPTDLGVPDGAHYSYANDVNDLGYVLGGCIFEYPGTGGELPTYEHHTVIWSPDGTPNDLGQLFPTLNYNALAMNNAGLVLGYSFAPGATGWWIRKTDGAIVFLDGLGAGYVNARGINEFSLIVGTSEYGVNGYRATIWNPDGSIRRRLEPLAGTTFSMGYGINNLGQVVGESVTVDGNGNFVGFRPTLWQVDGTPVDLVCCQSSGRASLIGDNGWILVESVQTAGTVMLCIPVPEPSTVLGLVCGIAGIAFRRNRRSF